MSFLPNEKAHSQLRKEKQGVKRDKANILYGNMGGNPSYSSMGKNVQVGERIQGGTGYIGVNESLAERLIGREQIIVICQIKKPGYPENER